MDLDKFSGKPRSAPGSSPRLLHVGRISYEKNCQVILRAFAIIRETIPDATMDIVGDGPALASLKIEAKHLGLDDSVSFPGFVPHNTLPEIYPQYDLFLTASTMETQGLVVLEATASGLPCIGVESYALPELIHDGRNGFITEPFDHKAIAEKTIEILENSDLYEKFSRESLAIASQHDIHICADRLEEVYRIAVSGEVSSEGDQASLTAG
jgi:glycosyltransferase involved in cell wall biosynthesis